MRLFDLWKEKCFFMLTVKDVELPDSFYDSISFDFYENRDFVFSEIVFLS